MADKFMKSLDFGGEDRYFPLPIVNSDDKGKILMVTDNGEWEAATIVNAEEVAY